MLVVARVQEEELAEADKALATNTEILKLDENNGQAIAALERLYLRTERYNELLGIYEKKLRLESDKEAQKEIRYKVASIFELEIKDNARAVVAYQDILKDFADELQAFKALDRIYVATEKWSDLSPVIQRELGLVPPGRRRGHRRAEGSGWGSCASSTSTTSRARIDMYRDILDLEATHAGARAALEKRLTDEQHQLTAAAILEPIYERTEEWARLIDVHEIQLRRENFAVAEDAFAAAHRRAARGTRRAQRRQGVRRLCARLPRRSADGDGAHRARAAGDDQRRLAAVRVAVRVGDREAQARRRRGAAASRALDQGRRGLRREAGEAGEGDGVLPAGAGDRSRRSDGDRGAGAALHAQRALARAARGLPQEGRAVARRGGARAESTSAWRTCGKRCWPTSTRRSRRTKKCSGPTAPTSRRSSRSTACIWAASSGVRWPTT